MLAEEHMAFLQDPGMCAGEDSFPLQALLTAKATQEAGQNRSSEVLYIGSKIQRFCFSLSWQVV